VTALESSTKVQLGGTRGGPDEATVRKDRWWIQPVLTVTVLAAFVVYSTWAAFRTRTTSWARTWVETSLVPSTHLRRRFVRTRSEVCLRLERLDDIAGPVDLDLPLGLSPDLLLLPPELLPGVLVVPTGLRCRGRARFVLG